MSAWSSVSLDDVFDIARGGSPRPIDEYITDDPGGINWVMIADASEGSKYITKTRRRIRAEGAKRSRAVKPGDFLLTNSMSFGRPYIMQTSGCIHDGWLVLSPKRPEVDSDFFYHLLGSKSVYSEFERRAAGVTVKNLNIDLVKGVTIRLPPLSEQKRIATVLDRADGLRARRRAALAQLDTLTQAIFLEMFGDPLLNPKGWPVVRLLDLLSIPLRNGMSPSKRGRVQGRVLTLSAITGKRFDDAAWKHSTFDRYPPGDQTVDARDFLICRGNGNVTLVGRGYFPKADMAGVAFPDTIIAARVEDSVLDRAFLQRTWNSSAVRHQIEAVARTTTGTFKINQTMLENIRFYLPPMEAQRAFARSAAKLEAQRCFQDSSAASLDALFASLQHRAFRGDL